MLHRLGISAWFCRFGECFCGLSLSFQKLCDKDWVIVLVKCGTHRWRRLSSPAALAPLCTGRCIWRWDSSYPSRDSRSPSRCWSSPRPHAPLREDREDLRVRRAGDVRTLRDTENIIISSSAQSDLWPPAPRRPWCCPPASALYSCNVPRVSAVCYWSAARSWTCRPE